MSNSDANSVLELRDYLANAINQFSDLSEFIVASDGIRASAKSLAREHVQYCIVRLQKAMKNLSGDFDKAEMQLSKAETP